MGRVLDLQNVKSRHLPLLTGGGGLKQQVTKQVCDKILSQGKSLVGG